MYSARDDATVGFAGIQNTNNGGIFLSGFQPLFMPGPNGIVGTVGQSGVRGSMVSLFYSQYATGVFKCCGTVYSPLTRNYAFDTDFLDLSQLPPGTPKFRDVVNVGFQQVY